MPINFNVKTKIKINGKEYNSPEEMPPDIRSLYEKAMANREGSSANIPGTTNSNTTNPLIGQNGTSTNTNVAAVGGFAKAWNNFWGSVWNRIFKK